MPNFEADNGHKGPSFESAAAALLQQERRHHPELDVLLSDMEIELILPQLRGFAEIQECGGSSLETMRASALQIIVIQYCLRFVHNS